MKKKIKRLIGFVSYLASVVLITGVLGNFFVNNPYTEHLVQKLVESELEGVRFETLNISVLPPKVEIYNVMMERPEHDTPIGAAYVSIIPSLRSIFWGQLIIDTIEVTEVSLNRRVLSQEEDIASEGQDKDGPKLTPISWPPDMKVPVRRVVLKDISIALQLLGEKGTILELSSPGTDIFFQLTDWNEIEAEITSKQFSLRVEGQSLLRKSAVVANLTALDSSIEADIAVEDGETSLQGKLVGNIAYNRSRAASLLEAKRLITQTLKHLQLTGQFEVTTDLEVLGRYLQVPDSKGQVVSPLIFTGTLPFPGVSEPQVDWEITMRPTIEDGYLFGFGLRDLRGQLTIHENDIAFQQISLLRDGQEVGALEGRLGFGKDVPFEFQLPYLKLPLSELLQRVKVPDFQAFDGQVQGGNIRVFGEGDPFRLQVDVPDLQISQLTSERLPTDFVDGPRPECGFPLSLVADSDKVAVKPTLMECTIDGELSLAAMEGKFYYKNNLGMNLLLDGGMLKAPLVSSFLPLPLQGQLELRSVIKGPYDELMVHSIGSSPGLQSGGLEARLDKIIWTADIANAVIGISHLDGQLPSGGRFHFNKARFQLESPYEYRIHGEGQRVPSEMVANIFEWLDEPLEFAIEDWRIDLEGDLEHFLRSQGSLHVYLKDVIYDEEPLVSMVAGRFDLTEDAVSASQLAIGVGQLLGKLDLDVKRITSKDLEEDFLGIGRDSPVRLRLVVEEDSALTQGIDQLPFVGSALRQGAVDGALKLDMALTGNLHRLEGKFDAKLYNLTVLGSRISPVYLQGFVLGSQLDVPYINHAGDALQGRLKLNILSPGIDYEWFLRARQLDIRPILTEHFADDPRNFAYLTGEWSMSGSLLDWWNSKGGISVEDFQMNYVRDIDTQTTGLSLAAEQPSTFLIEDGRWVFREGEQLKLKGEEVSLEVNTGNNRLPDGLDLRMSGILSLRELGRLEPTIEIARGFVDIDGAIRGSISDVKSEFAFSNTPLTLDNVSTWQPIQLGFIDYAPSIQDIELRVIVRNGQLFLEKFNARKGKQGKISLSGRYDFTGSEPSRVAMEFDRIEFTRLPSNILRNIDSQVSGTLVLEGDRLPLALSGQVDIQKMDSISGLDIKKKVLQLFNRRGVVTDIARREPFLNLDVGVRSIRPLRILNRNFDLLLTTDLSIQGTDVTPLILGEIEVPSGTFIYKRDFDITKGIISFDEAVNPPNPKLNITGVSLVSNYAVFVTVTGTYADPKVSLSIDPSTTADGTPIDKVAILALLSSGRLPSANRTVSKTSDVVGSEVINLMTGPFEETFERLFEQSGQKVIRRVYIEGYTSETRGGGRVSLPIELGDYVNFVVKVDDRSNFDVSFEYLLEENVTAAGSIKKDEEEADENVPFDWGGDINFRFSFP